MSETDAGAEDTAELLSGPRLPAHLYAHVPFCRSKCAYCDFYSVPAPDVDTVAAVFDAMEAQVSHWAQTGLPGVLETVYVGGGTPSAWPAPVASLLHHVRRMLLVQADAEVTVEANPDSLDEVTTRVLAEAGATRVSVGVQSFDEGVLRLLGRRHGAADAERACAQVVSGGLELSVDLICGVPGQTVTSWSETLERAASTGAAHVSVYPLSVEDGTPLQVAVSAGMVAEPSSDEAADMMLLAEEALRYHGLRRYEVANYAKPGHESRHNWAYWSGRPYIGVGPAAHEMFDAVTAAAVGLSGAASAGAARVRHANVADIETWMVGRGDSVEVLTRAEADREDVMLGLRLASGVPAEQVDSAGLVAVLESLRGDGLVELVDSRWRTTRRGWLLGNEVFGRVWAGD